ncbi:MAG: type I DNA topoisomerase [Syntrophobacteraceae bacterium]
MPKSLLIVESPTKAKTLGRFLGKEFIVKASVGHVIDLPKNKLGIDLEKEFTPQYQVITGKKKIISELTAAAAGADAIFLGPDPDREGEAIAWHIAEAIKIKDKPIHRVLFYELTHKAILEALAHPIELNKARYDAQQARRILDRLVGYLISPLLWLKVKAGLSAGRVQSVALRLICERESEIRKFETEEYWTIETKLVPGGDALDGAKSFTADLRRCRKKKCSISSKDEADRLVESLKAASYSVSRVEKKKRKRNPSPPFITSTLQQEAARKLNYSAKQTMSLAQRLYEGIEVGEEGAVGLITYMRTDSTRLSQDAVHAARDYILGAWDAGYLPARPVVYKTKGSAQDAHEAIRPTDVSYTPGKVAAHLSKDLLELYTLIWKRFVACQMSSAVIDQTTVDIVAGDNELRATGSVIEFPGFMTLYVEARENGDSKEETEWLPDLVEGQAISLLDVAAKQHFTQPPPRFSEAALIKELEEKGIGRPSTYASIVSTILDREYVTVQKRSLCPTELGWFINGLLVDNFPDIVDVEFTAKMEESLDEIEKGGHPYNELLSTFYRRFAATLDSAQSNMLNFKSVGLPTELKCPKCKRPLHIRFSRNGPFIACSGYPTCSFSSDYSRDEKGHLRLAAAPSTDEKCEKCGRPMIVKRGRFGEFLACSGYPLCKSTRAPSTGIPCPAAGCGGELVERVGKRGKKFYGCNRYPDCKTVFWDRPVLKTCMNCGASVLLEKHMKRGGVKLICSNPACRNEIREEQEATPEVSEGTR